MRQQGLTTRFWSALSPRLPVREDWFARQAVAQFDFGCWQRSTRSPSQTRQAVARLDFGRQRQSKRLLSQERQAATQLLIRCWSKGIAPLAVPPADSSPEQTRSNWSG